MDKFVDKFLDLNSQKLMNAKRVSNMFLYLTSQMLLFFRSNLKKFMISIFLELTIQKIVENVFALTLQKIVENVFAKGLAKNFLDLHLIKIF